MDRYAKAANALMYTQITLAGAAAAALVLESNIVPALAVSVLILGLLQPLLTPGGRVSRLEALRMLLLVAAMAGLGAYTEALSAHTSYTTNAGVLVVTILAPLVYSVAVRANPLPAYDISKTLSTLASLALGNKVVHYALLLVALYNTRGGPYSLPPLTLILASAIVAKKRDHLLLAAATAIILADLTK